MLENTNCIVCNSEPDLCYEGKLVARTDKGAKLLGNRDSFSSIIFMCVNCAIKSGWALEELKEESCDDHNGWKPPKDEPLKCNLLSPNSVGRCQKPFNHDGKHFAQDEIESEEW